MEWSAHPAPSGGYRHVQGVWLGQVESGKRPHLLMLEPFILPTTFSPTSSDSKLQVGGFSGSQMYKIGQLVAVFIVMQLSTLKRRSSQGVKLLLLWLVCSMMRRR